MSNELAERGKVVELALDNEQIELLKRTIAKGATDDEFAMFLHQSKRTGLDPFSRQIHLVKRKRWNDDKKTMEEVATIQVGIDGYRLIAERTGHYIPGEITYKEKDGALVSATATVLKIYNDKPYPVQAEARLEEYMPRTKEGKTTPLWTKMPYLMLGKCAESLALRKAFPQELSGMYTDAEMSQADSEDRAVKKELRETVSKEAKESQKALNAQAKEEIEAGRLRVALPPVEPTAEEIQQEGEETFGGGPVGPEGEEIPARPDPEGLWKLKQGADNIALTPLGELAQALEASLLSMKKDKEKFYQACVHKFCQNDPTKLLGNWLETDYQQAYRLLTALSKGEIKAVVKGGQPMFVSAKVGSVFDEARRSV